MNSSEKRVGGFSYLIRIPSSTRSRSRTNLPPPPPNDDDDDDENLLDDLDDTSPIVFLHGLGIGPSQHFIFINTLLRDMKLAHRIILIPIQPFVSQNVFHGTHVNPPCREEFLGDLCALVRRVGRMGMGMGLMGRGIWDGGKQSGVTVIRHSN